MADVAEDIELGEVILILAAVGIGGYLVYNGWEAVKDYFASATDITKVGVIPGITGPSAAQQQATALAAKTLPPGGSIIWSCGSDFDYVKPSGDVIQARHNVWNYFWPWSQPVTYTTVPAGSYVRPAGGTVNPRFACCYGCSVPVSAAGSPACCGGKQNPCLYACVTP